MKKRSTRRGAPFFARSPAWQRCWGCAPTGRGDFAARKGCFCPCTVQGASQRGHSLSQKRMAPLEPKEKGLDWQSRARMTFVPLEWKCLRGGIASLAANGSARRFASAPIIRCRSAYLVGVQPNFRLPPVSTMRRAQQCRYFARSPPPSKRHSRLTIVRRGCKTVTIRRDSWRSHVHRTYIAQRLQFFKLQTANVGGRGDLPSRSLGGSRGIFSHVREYPPFPVQRLRRCFPPCALWAQKAVFPLSGK